MKFNFRHPEGFNSANNGRLLSPRSLFRAKIPYLKSTKLYGKVFLTYKKIVRDTPHYNDRLLSP